MNVTRLSLFASAFFISTICYSQGLKLDGYFVSQDKGYNTLGSDYFFFKGNSFRLIRITDTEDEYGIGKFTVSHDSIEFRFGPVDNETNVKIEAGTRATDSVFIQVAISDKKSGNPSPANIVIVGSKKGTFAGMNGVARMRFLKREMNMVDTVRISFEGCPDVLVPVNFDVNNQYKISAKLTQGYRYYADGESLKYKFDYQERKFSLVILNKEVMFGRTTKNKFYRAMKVIDELAGVRTR